VSVVSGQEKSFVFSSDSIISEGINLTDSSFVKSSILDLQNMGTRFMIAPNRKQVAEWIQQKFLSLNITNTYIDSFQCYVKINYENLHYDTTTWQYNVIARIEGSEMADEVILLSAHYDNVAYDTDPEVNAPGADDNGSGVAALFETARIIQELDYSPKRSIEFAAFAAEELMNFGDSGAEHYASVCDEENKNIFLMINNDMIAYEDSWTISMSSFYESDFATDITSYINNNYVGLLVDYWDPGPGFADVEAFWEQGVSCIYLMESVWNNNYHSSTDLVSTLDMNYCTSLIKITVGTTILASNELLLDLPKQEIINLSIYPNPVSNQINIILNKLNVLKSYKIYDLTGRLVLKGEFQNDSTRYTKIDVDKLNFGIYLLQIETNNKNLRTKFVKQ